jgi:recombination protein RecT
MTTGAIEKAAADANAPAKITPKQHLTNLLDTNKGAFGASLPAGMKVERFQRLLLTAVNTNPDLLTCDPRSFIAAGVTAAQLGLEPNDPRGLAYLIPFNDRKKGRVVNFIIGYRGMLDLARRSGMVSSINAFPVFKGDTFEYRLGLDPHLEHIPAEDQDDAPENLTHVYAVAKVQGEPQFVVLTRKQIDRTRSSSQGAKSSYSPWNTHYVEMALKTALRKLCKWLPQTVEMARIDDLDGRDLRLNPDMLTDTPLSSVEHADDDVIDVESSEAGDNDGPVNA